MIAASQASLGILAGGRAARLGGIDKAFAHFRGESLLARTLRAFPEPFAARLFSYNRQAGTAIPDLLVVPDLRPDQPGPLAALEALLHACSTPWLLTVPVDVRDWPPGLAGTMLERVDKRGLGSVLADGDGLQPLVGIWNVLSLRASISSTLDSGERAAHRWLATHALPVHDISPARIGNLNAAADFANATR